MLVVAGLTGDLQQCKNSFFKISGFNKFVYLCLPKKSGSKTCFDGKVLSKLLIIYLPIPQIATLAQLVEQLICNQ